MAVDLQAVINRAAEFGIKARVWEKNGLLRIYAKTDRRDITVFLEIENYDCCQFKIFCTTAQHANWIKSQIEIETQKYKGLFYAWVIEAYKDVGPEPNGFGPSINEMINEARVHFVELQERQRQRALAAEARRDSKAEA